MPSQWEECMMRLGAIRSVLLAAVAAMVVSFSSTAQAPIGNETYTFKIYHVNYGFYPFVQAYMRTFDQNQEPLVNVNLGNIGVMVKGRSYDLKKLHPQTNMPQYNIETLQNRAEGFRTVFVWDCSGTMDGQPFLDARTAITRFIEAKRPSDEVAILAIRDTDTGYQIVSTFEKDPTLLMQRIADVKADGQQTRLYDAIGAAIQMCATASQGSINNVGAEYAVLNCIVALSDGKDEGSALAREELISRLNSLGVPVPVFALAYAKPSMSSEHFKNLEAISKATFGRYWTANQTQEFASVIQKIHQINRSDYVVTFRSYVPIDGEAHNFKVGLAYPSNTGRGLYQEGSFEAIQSPALAFPEGQEYWARLNAKFPELPGANPYLDVPGAGAAAAGGQDGTQSAMQQMPVGAPDTTQLAQAGEETPVPGAAQDPAALEPAPAPAPQEDSAEEAVVPATDGNVNQMLLLAVVGLGILVLIMAVVMWVRTSPTVVVQAPQQPHPGTSHSGRSTTGTGGGGPTQALGDTDHGKK
jgi:hypothetical protein